MPGRCPIRAIVLVFIAAVITAWAPLALAQVPAPDAAAAQPGGTFSPAEAPAPSPAVEAPFQRDSRFVLGARPTSLQAAAPGSDVAGNFAPATAPAPSPAAEAPFQRDSRFMLGARPKSLQAAAPGSNDAGTFAPATAPAPSPAAEAPFQRDSRFVLGARPKELDALLATSLQAKEGGFVRAEKYVLPAPPRNVSFGPVNTTAAAEVETVMSFVKTQGTNFIVNGQIHYFSGSNDYFLILRNYLTDAQVATFFQVMAGKGIDLIRTWGFLNGAQDPYAVGVALQPSIGVYDEVSMKRLDLIVSEASKNGVYLILPLVNRWPDLGGMQWYVDQVLGTGHALEEFYTNPAVIKAYKAYVTKILTRVNTLTGVPYNQEPAIMSIELANEPSTTNGYEDSKGVPRGSTVKSWVSTVATFVRSIDSNHLISVGDEGFLAQKGGATWAEDGTAGVDFQSNLQDPNIAFGTLHVYPCNWGIAASSAYAFMNNFIATRGAIATSIGKPFILEETGMDPKSYALYQPDYYRVAFTAAEAAGAKAMMPWELVAWHVDPNDSGGFDFSPDDPSFAPVAAAIAYQESKSSCASAGTCAAPAATAVCTCGDIAPGTDYTCAEQFGWHGIAMCSYSWMGPGYCDASCGRCTKCGAAAGEENAPPTSTPPTVPAPTTPPAPGTPPGTIPPVPVVIAPACAAALTIGPVWSQGGGQYGAVVSIALSAPDVDVPTPYTLTLSGSAPYISASTWEWAATVTPGGQITGAVRSQYNALAASGKSTATIGSVVVFSDLKALVPTSVTVNGQACTMTVAQKS